jgi:dTDP-4-dehydrorhamnose reductase
MKILVVGASGYIGAELYRNLRGDYDTIGTFHTSQPTDNLFPLDTTNVSETRDFIAAHNPDVIVHAANASSVRWCEEHPELAAKVNIEGTEAVVAGAQDSDAQLIYLSSTVASNQQHVYGRTKSAAEAIVRQATCDWLVLRPSLTVGISPNVLSRHYFNRILQNIRTSTDGVYDDSWKLQLTSLAHIAEVVRYTIDQRICNTVIPIATEEVTTRYAFASEILRHFGLKTTADTSLPSITEPYADVSVLHDLGLPAYSLAEIVRAITSDIEQHTH